MEPAKTGRVAPESNGHHGQVQPNGRSQVTAPEPKRWTLTRLVVVGVVILITLTALPTGAVWGVYRIQHTVVDNATVKGHIHKVGARIDGQVESVEVQPGQRIAKDQILFRLAPR